MTENENNIPLASFLTEEIKAPLYYKKVKQSPVTDEMRSKLIAPKNLSLFETGEAHTGISQKNKPEMNLMIDNYTELEKYFGKEINKEIETANTSPELTNRLLSANRLLDGLILAFSRQVYPKKMKKTEEAITVTLPLQEYAELIGVTDMKELRKTVIRDLNILKLIKFTYTKNPLTKGNDLNISDFWDVYLIGDKGIKNSQITVEFNKRFVNILLGQPSVLDLDTDYMRESLKERPHVFMLSPKIQSLLKMNLKDIRKNKNIYKVSVRILYEYCQTLPRYEEVIKKDRHVEKRIIKPFEKALDYICEKRVIKGIKWNYDSVDANSSWNKWLNSSVEFDCSEYYYPGEEKMIKNSKKSEEKTTQKLIES